jgi:hypothetical protein
MSWGILQSLEHTNFGATSGAPDTVRCPGQSTSRIGRSRVFLRATPLKFTGLSGAARGQMTSTVNSSKPQRSADVARTGQ